MEDVHINSMKDFKYKDLYYVYLHRDKNYHIHCTNYLNLDLRYATEKQCKLLRNPLFTAIDEVVNRKGERVHFVS